MFRDAAGAPSFAALPGDPDPSPMVESLRDIGTDPARILHPVVRDSFLRKGRAAGGAGRGREPFVRVSWDAALDLAAAELDRVRAEHGNEAIYGGSYGWASAGRFHHAQSQVHRFLNTIGGYTRSVQNYSFAAADIILPHVIGDRRGLTGGHTSWRVLAGHAGLIVMFGGAPRRNGQVAAGGVIRHSLRDGLLACRRAGVDFVSVSPMRDDVIAEAGAEWLPVRPNSDVALMLALAHTLVAEGLHDRAFLDRYTVGFDRFRAYLDGSADGVAKSADWAAPLAEVPAGTIRALARRMARSRTFLMMAWSLQRADHGEQPCWALIALAALLGQIGLPGGGFGLGYGSANGVGNPGCPVAWPSLPQGTNPVGAFIPVARVADMLLKPGEPFDFNGNRHTYPDIRLVYWAGGNPFHHHQDLNRLAGAWQRPETVIVNESFWTPTARHADIVFPVTTFVERNDIACRHGEPFVVASHRIADPPGEARDDYAVFRGLAARLGAEERFTEGRDEADWLRALHAAASRSVAALGASMPDFETFWEDGVFVLPDPATEPCLLDDFRRDPDAHRLKTPSGRIELFSETIAGFGYPDCPGHPAWIEPAEWLGSAAAADYPLHLLSTQPERRLHSQLDSTGYSRDGKVAGREPLRLNPDDAARRGIRDRDVVLVRSARGRCLAAAVVSDALRPGVAHLATGAWYDPDGAGEDPLDRHGNPNTLTLDKGTSRLAQGPSAQTCLVEVERFADGPPPPVRSFVPPTIIG